MHDKTTTKDAEKYQMKAVTAIRHVHFEDLGVFEDVLIAQGIAIRYMEAGVDDLTVLRRLDDALLIVLGGPIGAYEENKYPFLAEELHVIEARLARGLPTLGICLGAQLMARALGASVHPATQKEIGWGQLALTKAGLHSPLRHLADAETRVLHWHGDTFDLPAGATLLASTDICSNQAFSWKTVGLGLQFHLEVRPGNIERWLIGHACELSGPSMPDLASLRADTIRYGLRMQTHAAAIFGEWLACVGLLEHA